MRHQLVTWTDVSTERGSRRRPVRRHADAPSASLVSVEPEEWVAMATREGDGRGVWGSSSGDRDCPPCHEDTPKGRGGRPGGGPRGNGDVLLVMNRPEAPGSSSQGPMRRPA